MTLALIHIACGKMGICYNFVAVGVDRTMETKECKKGECNSESISQGGENTWL